MQHDPSGTSWLEPSLSHVIVEELSQLKVCLWLTNGCKVGWLLRHEADATLLKRLDCRLCSQIRTQVVGLVTISGTVDVGLLQSHFDLAAAGLRVGGGGAGQASSALVLHPAATHGEIDIVSDWQEMGHAWCGSKCASLLFV
jgi:hypothetical protein